MQSQLTLLIKLAYRNLLKRKGRTALIAVLVCLGSFLLSFGTAFIVSTSSAAKLSIINNFTGDFIVYSSKSKDVPTPFGFTTPLPNIPNLASLKEFVEKIPGVDSSIAYAQNFGGFEIIRDGKKISLPFIFYSYDPMRYKEFFNNVQVVAGKYYSDTHEQGILISEFQNEQYFKNYGVRLKPGDNLTLYATTEGGVNALQSKLIGIFKPIHFSNIFNYVNILDDVSYSQLYNFTGVTNLPSSLGGDSALSKDDASEDDIFALADNKSLDKIDVSNLKSEALSGFTILAVKLKDDSQLNTVLAAIAAHPELGVKTAPWNKASGFYAQISLALQAFIYLATGLIFLVVAMVLANTLIINIMERTAEIGTMRALGCDRSFVLKLFFTETMLLNLTACIVTLVFTLLVVIVLSFTGLPLGEQMSQYLVGGGNLIMQLSLSPFIITIISVAVISILATISPVRYALTITPLKAMAQS